MISKPTFSRISAIGHPHMKSGSPISGATERESTDDNFAEWAYDDRLHCDPWVQDITKEEHAVLRRYPHCR
ncbi:MAG: hypothetical protein QF918_00795 [Pirellulaceae bacterium]|nr:hypothetical protein [Pirellulaceae bacterium]